MSINEHHRNQNLSFHWTNKQKREAEAACRGATAEDMIVADRKFSEEEIQNMRLIVAQHERQGIREFDLNNPPRKPYLHQEYPKTMYNHETGANVVVQNADAEEKAIAESWSVSSVPIPQQVVEEVTGKPTKKRP